MKRLRAMTPAEVLSRAGRTFRHRIDAAMFVAAPGLWRRTWEPGAQALLRSRPAAAPRGFLTAARAADVRMRFPRESEDLVARADLLLEDRYRFFGYGEIVPPDRFLDRDPFTGCLWPDKHGKRIEHRYGEYGDPKWIWELNRCQDLPVLVAGWLLSGDRRYASAAAERLERWIRTHPPGRGIAWSNGFEAGVRAISLTVTIDALRGSPFLPPEREALALRALWQHVRWIERDPATGSSANNHRIGELAGIVAVGVLARELRDADRWLDGALAELAREAGRQIRTDGTNAEQAFGYQVFVLDLLLVTYALSETTGRKVPDALTSALIRSGHALWAQLGDDEPEPTYGDSDDGRALVLDAAERRSGRGIAAGIAAATGDGFAGRAGGALDMAAYWLFGAEGAERASAAAAAVPEPGCVTLPDAGLTILRAGTTRVLVDHGVHGYLSLAAHAHADALAIELSRGARPLVVDPGTGSYFARPDLRAAFRGTGFHATVGVDGKSSSEPGGPFLWTRHARARALAVELESGVIVCEQDGYECPPDPVTHRRAVVLLDEGLVLVVDRLESGERHRFSQRWPLHPDLELQRQDDARAFATDSSGERGVLLVSAASQPIAIRAARGELDPPLGWWSPGLESVVPSWLIAVDVDAVGDVEISTILAPFERDVPDLDLRASHDRRGRGTVIEIVSESGSDEIALDLGATPPAVTRARLTRT